MELPEASERKSGKNQVLFSTFLFKICVHTLLCVHTVQTQCCYPFKTYLLFFKVNNCIVITENLEIYRWCQRSCYNFLGVSLTNRCSTEISFLLFISIVPFVSFCSLFSERRMINNYKVYFIHKKKCPDRVFKFWNLIENILMIS